jgi:acetylornithine aminotransferase
MTQVLWYPGHELILDDIVRAENCHLFDSRGNRYVDLESGVWCTSVGHANPRILRIIQEQLARVGHTGFCYTNEVVVDAARDFLSLLGFDGGKCVFLCSGSEAVEYGVRVAQSLTDRPLFLTMADSYFGAYGSASRKRADEWFCFDWMECAGCSPDKDCDGSCGRWASIPFDKIGGFLFEPGSSSGPVRFPPKKLIQQIVRAVREANGIILVNEVTTGVGRTGMWFGYQHYDLSPDIVAAGKGIGNGYPVSVAAFGPRVVDRLGGREVKYAQSHQNDPVGAAVVREVIRLIREEGLIERGREIAKILLEGLERIRSRSGAIREIRARGLMAAVELIDDPETSFTIRTHRELVRRGFIVGRRPGASVLRIDPSLTIERGDIEAFLIAFEEILAARPNP